MDKFNGTHLFFVLSGMAIVSMKTYPRLYTEIGGRDSWIAVICSGILLMLFAYMIISITEKNNNYNMKDIYCTAMGKTLGNILIWCFIITLFLTLVECSSVESNSMHVNMLANTPPWFFTIFFAIPAIYTFSRGKNAIVIVSIIGMTFVSISGTNLAILTSKYKNFNFLLPIMEKGVTPNFIMAIVKSLGFFSFFSMILPFLTEIKNKNTLKKSIFIALLFIIQMEVVSTMGIISTFGALRGNIIYYPKLIQTQLINYWGFLESGELYVLLQVIAGWYIKYVLTLFSMKLILKKLNIDNRFYIYCVTLLVLISSFFLSKDIKLLFKSLNIFIYIALANFIIIPTIVYITFHIRNKKTLEKINPM
ncbi:putative spore germination protein [Clostridium pasteurianum DSM 525 = ATCC 6013]|uniref:Spore germination protein n=1 Tax=Clostridium pasteurianum DSM 525 = ATCC 6013 TaxID=1262449 RepID=A0A0H3J1U5_CLOPA|nr:endospore germination permease [Clostridium pasteurianum]AJA47384.1 putative spore germination protein [Clostridium pasteurianum DSM 525 = ATCC 6013]AJA51372.1 putative spore germination protein [Clostridium pasteurianum DSM 525 = ATCC 6013]AOZ74713.1 spore gernimation protein [Clostridium pasteurianum DSM 525 = ATCC 6013]AOZ78509.1 spore gernimation protein [Clostridium pasteurianum]ELP58720.1 Putative spore germination protein [Clostridium pasteurianum DSM 525 = ATCC 6013]